MVFTVPYFLLFCVFEKFTLKNVGKPKINKQINSVINSNRNP